MLIHFGNGHINLFIYIYTHIYTYNFLHLFLFGYVLGLCYYAGFSLVAASRDYSWLQFTDFSSWWLLLLWGAASRCPGFSSCIFWALEHSFCDWRTKRGQEELPHVRGQRQKLGGPHAQRVVAKRSYPMSEVRGSSRECQATMVQERPRGAALHPRSGAASRSNPTSKEQWLHGRRRA